MNDTTTIKLVIASIGAVLAWLLGGFDSALQGLCLLITLDIFTGLLKAFSLKTLSSDVSFRGMSRKVLIFSLVAVGVVVDRIIGTESLLRNGVILFYSISEGLSILENTTALGLPVPAGLRDALTKLQEKAQSGP